MSFLENRKNYKHSAMNSSINGIGKYIFEKTIGEGTFGKVKLSTHITTKEKVAIKILEKDKILEPEDLERINREITFLKKLNHKNIIKIYEIIENSKNFYIIMEYASGGELFSYIVSKKRLSSNEASFFFVQIINGLEYIHQNNIVHRDLKPENLLLNENKIIKFIDFGLSNQYQDNQLLETPCGSPCYAAPEMIQGKKYSGLSVDLWSTGIILYAIVCGFLPFEDKNNEKLYKKIIQCKLDFPSFLSDSCVDILQKILVVDPINRIGLKEIKNHPFFKNGEKLLDNEEYLISSFQKKLGEKVINEMITLGFKKEEIEFNINNKKHNEVTTTYDLLIQKFIKVEKSDYPIEIKNHCNNNDLTFQNTISTSNEAKSDLINLNQKKNEKQTNNNEKNINNHSYYKSEILSVINIDHNRNKKFKTENVQNNEVSDKKYEELEEKRIFLDKIKRDRIKKNNYFIDSSNDRDYINRSNKINLNTEKLETQKRNYYEKENEGKKNLKQDNFFNLSLNIDNNILLTEEESSKTKDFLHFNSRSPYKNAFIIHQSNDIDTYNKNKREFKLNPMSNSLDGNLNKERQMIKDNFISIKEKINLIKDSVVNDRRLNSNRICLNIEKRYLMEEMTGIQKMKPNQDTHNKTNSNIASKQKKMEVITEDVELKNKYFKLNDPSDLALEEKLVNLKNKLKLKNKAYDTLTLSNTISTTGKNETFEKLMNKSKSKDKKFYKILDSMKKIRKYSSNDSINKFKTKFNLSEMSPNNKLIDSLRTSHNVSNISKLPDSMIDNTINSFSRHKINFLNKFSTITKKPNNLNFKKSETTSSNNLSFINRLHPNTTKHNNNQVFSHFYNNYSNITTSNNRYSQKVESVSPKETKSKLKDSLIREDLDNFIKNIGGNNINLKKPKKLNLNLKSINSVDLNDSSKLMNKLALLRKNLFSNDNINCKNSEDLIIPPFKDLTNSPKEFACCAIYNNSSIQDKLFRYCSIYKIEINKTSNNKFNCKKEGNIFGIEFTKVGHKGMSFMKMFHIAGNEKQTRDLIKNVIINIEL